MIIAFIFIDYFVNMIYQLTCSTKSEVLFKINCYLIVMLENYFYLYL